MFSILKLVENVGEKVCRNEDGEKGPKEKGLWKGRIEKGKEKRGRRKWPI